MDKTVTKISETAVRITTKIPGKPAIPDQFIDSDVKLKDLKNKDIELDSKIVEWTGYRETPLKERQDKLNEIAAELAKIEKQIEDHENVYIKSHAALSQSISNWGSELKKNSDNIQRLAVTQAVQTEILNEIKT